MSLVSIVIPTYNESRNIHHFVESLYDVLMKHPEVEWETWFIDDGSRDGTRDRLVSLSSSFPNMHAIKFSKNFGKEMALTAGLEHAQGDAVITIDGDGQHPVEKIPFFVEKWMEWYDIVYNARPYIRWASWMKKMTSKRFYKIFNSISEFKIEPQTTDYRLLDKKVVDAFNKFDEGNRIYRWLVDRLWFKKTKLVFDALPNPTGRKPSYNYNKLISLALHSITSFSVQPLKFIGLMGFVIAMISGLLEVFILMDKLFWGNIYSFSNMFLMVNINVFFTGIMCMAMGLMAIYIANIHEEVKHRPLYIVDKKI